ncbi:rod shape-determining protein MreD [Guyparkeria sp. SCN-R1]|uniref:rod shape-determining protein MreD n=1 Tax=Guyparkeria sp. SCN-R1 TaxID=2341113 RepID=UPI00131507EA|nr:rod shape-determining protein MreD [Guyparkeria sp. SCN-R1]
MTTSWFAIILTSIAALALTLLPLPATMQLHNPQWLLLTIIFWSLYRPAQAGMIYAWIAGLMLDVATNGLLGLNALLFTMTAFLVLSLRQRLGVAPLLSQALLIAGFTLVYLMVALWVEGVATDLVSMATYLSRALSNLAAWPVVFFLLSRLARISER